MQTIEERSKRFIEDHIDELRAIARRMVEIEEAGGTNDGSIDQWNGVTLRDGKAVLISDLPAGAEIANDDCLADLNVWDEWNDDGTNHRVRVDAYPMMRRAGIVTTDTKTWVRLIGGERWR